MILTFYRYMCWVVSCDNLILVSPEVDLISLLREACIPMLPFRTSSYQKTTFKAKRVSKWLG